MTVNTRVIRILLHMNNMPYVEIQKDLRIQVLPDMSYLPRCQKHQFAAFIADRGILVVWDDQPKKVLERIQKLEAAIMSMIWQDEDAYPEEKDEKQPQVDFSELGDVVDPEAILVEQPRRIQLLQPTFTAITLCVTLSAIGAGYQKLAIEIDSDHNWIRVAFVGCLIPQIWLALVSTFTLRP